jgi:tetratricopeptide (TPR) repeat protein
MRPASAQRAVIVLALLLLVIAVFWPAGRYPYAGLDDDAVITHNPWVGGGLSVAGVRWAFTTLAGTMWFPLTWLSYMADVQVLGDGAGPHHLANLAIHAAAAALLFLVLAALTGSRWKSAFVAALFAVHPLHVESVVWITERKDVLSGLFWMITLAAYAWYCRKPARLRYLAVLVSFVLGLMAKPMLVTLPFVLALLDYWPLARFRGVRDAGPAARKKLIARLVVEKAPLLVVASGFSLLTVYAQGRGDALGSLAVVPLWARLANALQSYAWYLGKSLAPSGLAIYYPHPGASIAVAGVVAAAVVLAGVTWLALRQAARLPALLTGWLWYLGTLVPVIGVVQVGAYARADRFTYLPLIGLFIMAAWGAEALFPRASRWAPLPVAAAVATVLALAIAGAVQVGYWRDDERLFGHALAVTERNWMVHGNLGATLLEQGRAEDARREFEQALAYHPGYALARLNLGLALVRLGRGGEAEGQFLEVLRQNPDDANAHFSLGQYLAAEGRLGDALQHLDRAIQLAPDFIAAQQALGWALLKAGKAAAALERFRTALSLQPDLADAFNGAGAALAEQGQFAAAATTLQAALRLAPEDPEIHANFAYVLERLGRAAEADRERREAGRLRGGEK